MSDTLAAAIAILDRLYAELPRCDDLPVRVATLALELRERVRAEGVAT